MKSTTSELQTDSLDRVDEWVAVRRVLAGQQNAAVRGRVVGGVIDEGGGFERNIKRMGAGGWGLRIVDAESSRWGICPGAAHLWFELERSALQLEPAGSEPAGCR